MQIPTHLYACFAYLQWMQDNSALHRRSHGSFLRRRAFPGKVKSDGTGGGSEIQIKSGVKMSPFSVLRQQ
jgi:hypothetical protein